MTTNLNCHDYEFKELRRRRTVCFIRKFTRKTKYIFTFAWCRFTPIGFLNVRNLQVVLISLVMSTVSMMSNIRIIVLMMTHVYTGEGFHWDRMHQVVAHTLFFYGNISMSLASHVVSRYLNKSVTCGCLLMACIIHASTPFATRRGDWQALLIARFLLGMFIGILTESMYIALTKWSTKKDKMKMYCMALSGMSLGHAVMLIVVCSLYDSRFPWGLDFYFVSMYGCCILIIWLIFGSMDPEHCPYLSNGEKEYLQKYHFARDDLDVPFLEIPWKMIFSNVPFYALLAAEFSYRISFWFNVAQLPIFFAEVYGYPFWKAGLISALPHLLVWISTYPVCQMIGLFIRAKIVHVTAARKWCNLLALCFGSVCYFTMLGSKSLLGSVTSYTTAVTLEMYYMMGVGLNHIDLSPRYSGILLGIIRCVANAAAILSAFLVMWFVIDLQENNAWDPAFIFTGIISMLGGIVFFLFGDAEIQKFNYYPP